MKNIIKKKKGEASWITWIKKRIRNNLNFLAMATGPTGVGKSWTMLSIAYQIDPEFSIEQVSFSFSGLMQIINKFNDKDNELSKKKYKVCIFDECQTDISNREWQSKVNRLFNYLLSTFRHQNIIVLFTTPYQDFIDTQSLKLIHAVFECKQGNGKPLTERQQKIVDCWEKGMFKQVDIAKQLNLLPARVCENIARMRNKGYHMEYYQNLKENGEVL
jgi:hypothetical protein